MKKVLLATFLALFAVMPNISFSDVVDKKLPIKSAFAKEVGHKIRVYAWNVPSNFHENLSRIDSENIIDDSLIPNSLAEADLSIFVLNKINDVSKIPLLKYLDGVEKSVRSSKYPIKIIGANLNIDGKVRPIRLVFHLLEFKNHKVTKDKENACYSRYLYLISLFDDSTPYIKDLQFCKG